MQKHSNFSHLLKNILSYTHYTNKEEADTEKNITGGDWRTHAHRHADIYQSDKSFRYSKKTDKGKCPIGTDFKTKRFFIERLYFQILRSGAGAEYAASEAALQDS